MGMKIGVTGHRPENFPKWVDLSKVVDGIQRYIQAYVEDGSIGHVGWITGGARGVDLWVARRIITARGKNHLILPFPAREFTRHWHTEDREELMDVMMESTIQVMQPEFSKLSYILRDQAIVDQCDLLFAVMDPGATAGGTFQTVQYAKRMGKPIDILDVSTLCIEPHNQ
jgi:hypothetical protein